MLNFDSQGLIPVVVVDDETNDVLMMASMSRESLQLTREKGETYFFSRSRNKLWHKGEESGNVQEVRGIFVNCEENSLLIRVVQRNGAACHDGYHSCYYRELLPDDSLEIVTERLFDPAEVYHHTQTSQAGEQKTMLNDSTAQELSTPQKLERVYRQLYDVYISLRDKDQSAQSNTSRMLHEKDQQFFVTRLKDELGELEGVQKGEHVHSGRQADTALEGSQVGYWLFLLAVLKRVPYEDFMPHASVLHGYTGQYSAQKVAALLDECLLLSASADPVQFARALMHGFALIGWACVSAGISPLAPAEYDLEQMQAKGLLS
jgi:phosphoribosyl-AMP cyclohydrolase